MDKKRTKLSLSSFLAVPNHLDATLFFEKISNKPCFFQKF